jgi:hypothetical protein
MKIARSGWRIGTECVVGVRRRAGYLVPITLTNRGVNVCAAAAPTSASVLMVWIARVVAEYRGDNPELIQTAHNAHDYLYLHGGSVPIG